MLIAGRAKPAALTDALGTQRLILPITLAVEGVD
jgi:hypothetical protein